MKQCLNNDTDNYPRRYAILSRSGVFDEWSLNAQHFYKYLVMLFHCRFMKSLRALLVFSVAAAAISGLVAQTSGASLTAIFLAYTAGGLIGLVTTALIIFAISKANDFEPKS